MGVKEWELEKKPRTQLEPSTTQERKLLQGTGLKDNLIREEFPSSSANTSHKEVWFFISGPSKGPDSSFNVGGLGGKDSHTHTHTHTYPQTNPREARGKRIRG
jgi:hypothetical protein